MRAGIVTNGLGIIRHIDMLDGDFKSRHPDMPVEKRSDDPDIDKEIGDSTSLKPILSDFFELHPKLSYSTFLGDSAFDSYDNYSMLMKDFHFDKAVIPLNLRNSSKVLSSDFDGFGRPRCPIDGTPFICLGKSGGKKPLCSFQMGLSQLVASRFKKILCLRYSLHRFTLRPLRLHLSRENLRLYPGLPRESDEWDYLYKKRVAGRAFNQLLQKYLILGNRKDL